MDGTNGLTECPIAPGHSRIYRFKATQYGTSWYHSHQSLQYGEGLLGPIVIHGPSTSNYDIDLGALPITDWFRKPLFQIFASSPAAPPTSDSLLLNGTGVFNGTGDYATTTLIPGKKHKLRLINTSIGSYLHVGLDQHPFTVIAADFVPIKPFTTSSLSLAIGESLTFSLGEAYAQKDIANHYQANGSTL
jgi:FtsP/CotA-like multicopper oxidase with cupredoxin domain